MCEAYKSGGLFRVSLNQKCQLAMEDDALPFHGALASALLDGDADAVEFCPTHPFHNLLAAATYTLQQDPAPSRLGSLQLFALEDDGKRLHKLHHIHTSGVFDIKWRPREGDDHSFLAQASTDGTLRLYDLLQGKRCGTFQLMELARQNITSSMCLSLDWDPFNADGNNQLSVSQSDGCLAVVDFGNSQAGVRLSGQAHSFEAWSVAYDRWKPHVVYSGGDDSQFCGWDLREGFSRPVFRDKRNHEMGICTVQGNSYRDHVLATGSYDENLRLWDIRMLEKPVMTNSLRLGGGVWRLKWHPFDEGLLLAACMHNGFIIVNVREDKMCIVKEYHGHESLAYGADWFKGRGKRYHAALNHVEMNKNVDEAILTRKVGDTGSSYSPEDALSSLSEQVASTNQDSRMDYLVATCSFYDRALHIWKLN